MASSERLFMMLGYPSEEMADVESSLRLLRQIGPKYVGFSVAYPLRGTASYGNQPSGSGRSEAAPRGSDAARSAWQRAVYILRISQSLRVLVVEDDSYIRQLTIQVLEDEGHDLLAARNGAEALEAVRSTAPDLILLDLMMPVLDGVAFVEKCRQLPVCRDVPIVVMSAAGMRSRYACLDVEAWIDKPFDLDLLVRVIEQTLQQRPARHTEDVCAGESDRIEQRH